MSPGMLRRTVAAAPMIFIAVMSVCLWMRSLVFRDVLEFRLFSVFNVVISDSGHVFYGFEACSKVRYCGWSTRGATGCLRHLESFDPIFECRWRYRLNGVEWGVLEVAGNGMSGLFHTLMWCDVSYLVIVFVLSFVSCFILFAGRNRRSKGQNYDSVSSNQIIANVGGSRVKRR